MAEAATLETRPEWVCRGDGCGLRVRNADGRPIPEPKKWADGLCVPCRIAAEHEVHGMQAANELEDKILQRHRKRPNPFSHTDPEFGDGAKPKPKGVSGPPRIEPSPEQRDRIDRELETTCDTDNTIAKRVGVPVARVRESRERLGLPTAPERRVRLRRKKLAAFFADDPERSKWTSEEIAAAIGEEAGKIRNDKVALGYGVGRGNGRRCQPRAKNGHGGKREREARLSRIRAFVTENPRATNQQVADALGLQERRVQKDRHAMRAASEMPKSPA